MNIGQDDDLNVFVDRNEELFEVELPVIVPPYLPEKDVLESKEYLLAQLFKYLRSLYLILKDARKDLDLYTLIEFPEKFTIDSYGELLRKIPHEKKTVLNKWFNKIKERYSLLENWEISINTVILTHHFPIPYPNISISYYIPPTEEELQREREQPKTLSALAMASNLTRSWEVTRHPAIFFNSQTSPTSLIKWVKNHKYLFRAFNNRLKRETPASSKMNVRTQRIGELALIIKWSNTKKWSDMEKMIDEWEKKDGYDDYWGAEGRPTAEDLRIAFKSYHAVIVKLDSGNSESL